MTITVSAIALSCKLAAEVLLEALNRGSVRQAKANPPATAEAVMGRSRFQESLEYTLAKSRFGTLEMLVSTSWLLLFLLTGWLGGLHNAISAWLGYGPWGQGLTFFLVLGIFSLISLPLNWYETFRLEERFGFNKSSLGLWLMDLVKGMILSVLLGVPLLTLIFYLTEVFSESWWILGWGVFFGFQLLMVIAYPMFILPLFNKLRPLEEGSLRERLFDLARRTNFKAASIQVMDGSRRSAHSNAFFSGFGKFRRIVLYDTLMEQLKDDEIEAVLAHEIGHWRKGHIPKTLLLFGFGSLAVFYGLFLLAGWPGFVESFGFVGAGASEVEDQGLAVVAPALMLVGLLAGAFTFWLSPLMNGLSRKHEYEADAFARDALGSALPMTSALRKIYRENLGNLVPHRLYSAVHYSHPTLLEREAALLSESEKAEAGDGPSQITSER
ncbi:MAG: M48 family metallopeptidase [Puniceicoccaceae bacterium]